MGFLLLLFGLTLLFALFSAAEAALLHADRVEVEVEARHRPSAWLDTLTQTPSRPLMATLMGGHLVQAGLLVALVYVMHHRATVLSTQTLVWIAVGLAVSSGIVRGVLHTLVVPRATSLLLSLSGLLHGITLLFQPLVRMLESLAGWLHRLFPERYAPLALVGPHHLAIRRSEAREGEEINVDADETEDVLANVLSMGTLRAQNAMVPRTEMRAVEASITREELRERFVESGHSRLPVYEGNLDTIIGLVYAYDLFKEPANVRDLLRPALFVPESKPARDLLREMLANNSSLAIVVDEYGGTAGMVARKDLFDELLGEDEEDERADEIPLVRRITPDTLEASGRVELDTLADRFGLRFPEGDYETLAGFLLHHLGEVPQVNDEFLLEGYRFTILAATPHRIEHIRMVAVRQEPAE